MLGYNGVTTRTGCRPAPRRPIGPCLEIRLIAGHLPTPHDAILVTKRDEFQEFHARVSKFDRFAFDAEFVAEDGYLPEVCLIQVAVEGQIWLIDPLAGFDVRPFWELVVDARIEKIVHAGLEDLALAHQHTDRVPQNVFDTQIAAGLIGPDYPLSLHRLARATVGVRLHKSQTLTNWRKRPLTQKQIQYAIEDVAYMLEMHASIRDQLAERGRLDWAREEVARFSDIRTYQRSEPDMLWRIKGVGSLDRAGLAIARELVVERERLARRLNRPPRAMLKDHLLVAIAKQRMTQIDELRSLRGMQMRRDVLEAIGRAVQRGIDAPPAQWPRQAAPDDDTPGEVTLCKLVTAVLFDFCRRQDIAYQLMATNRQIKAAVHSHTRGNAADEPSKLQRGWRREALGSLIEDLLEGRCSVRVAPSKDGGGLIVE